MKKKEKSIQFLKENVEMFQCPVCKHFFEGVEQGTIVCKEGHTFDVSKKGTIHFLLKQSKNEYGRHMLESRAKVAKFGLWKPMLEEVIQEIESLNGKHLDVGCGEGSHLHFLTQLGLKGKKVGFDISKEAIRLAAAQYMDAFWCVADLADSPFQTGQYDTILNILSPSNYAEFDRLLKEKGQVIKVVPNKGYLKELREVLFDQEKPYSNKEVIQNFTEHYPHSTTKTIQYKVELEEGIVADLLNMTPLSWNVSEQKKKEFLAQSLSSVTVDLTLLIGQQS